MLIEEEAEAVFNEIRNRRRILVEDKKSVSREPSPGKKSVSPTPMITINVNVLSSPERSVPEIEEPVSPPSCHPDEGPPLLFSQSIEDLADVIVKENREKGDVEKKPVVGGETSSPSKIVPALIPLTVSEFAEKTASPPSSLRMSGGGVYTTDSYYRHKPAQTSVIKKLPVSGLAPTPPPTDCSVIKPGPDPPTEAPDQQNVLWKFYKKSAMITEARKTIKLSDGLEITPILTVPAPQPAQKRSHESTEKDGNERSKKVRSDLVIEKISKKNSKEEQSEQRALTDNEDNEQTFQCKLIVSKIDKKAKLVFENGSVVPLSKNILKHVVPVSRPTTNQSKRIRRKTVRTRKLSNSNVDSNKKNTEPVEDKKTPEPADPLVKLDMPVVVEGDSDKTEIPASCNKARSPVPAVGQHKLPSIVSPPSYHGWSNRKISIKSK